MNVIFQSFYLSVCCHIHLPGSNFVHLSPSLSSLPSVTVSASVCTISCSDLRWHMCSSEDLVPILAAIKLASCWQSLWSVFFTRCASFTHTKTAPTIHSLQTPFFNFMFKFHKIFPTECQKTSNTFHHSAYRSHTLALESQTPTIRFTKIKWLKTVSRCLGGCTVGKSSLVQNFQWTLEEKESPRMINWPKYDHL